MDLTKKIWIKAQDRNTFEALKPVLVDLLANDLIEGFNAEEIASDLPIAFDSNSISVTINSRYCFDLYKAIAAKFKDIIYWVDNQCFKYDIETNQLVSLDCEDKKPVDNDFEKENTPLKIKTDKTPKAHKKRIDHQESEWFDSMFEYVDSFFHAFEGAESKQEWYDTSSDWIGQDKEKEADNAHTIIDDLLAHNYEPYHFECVCEDKEDKNDMLVEKEENDFKDNEAIQELEPIDVGENEIELRQAVENIFDSFNDMSEIVKDNNMEKDFEKDELNLEKDLNNDKSIEDDIKSIEEKDLITPEELEKLLEQSLETQFENIEKDFEAEFEKSFEKDEDNFVEPIDFESFLKEITSEDVSKDGETNSCDVNECKLDEDEAEADFCLCENELQENAAFVEPDNFDDFFDNVVNEEDSKCTKVFETENKEESCECKCEENENHDFLSFDYIDKQILNDEPKVEAVDFDSFFDDLNKQESISVDDNEFSFENNNESSIFEDTNSLFENEIVKEEFSNFVTADEFDAIFKNASKENEIDEASIFEEPFIEECTQDSCVLDNNFAEVKKECEEDFDAYFDKLFSSEVVDDSELVEDKCDVDQPEFKFVDNSDKQSCKDDVELVEKNDVVVNTLDVNNETASEEKYQDDFDLVSEIINNIDSADEFKSETKNACESEVLFEVDEKTIPQFTYVDNSDKLSNQCDLEAQEESKEDVVVTPLAVDEVCECEAQESNVPQFTYVDNSDKLVNQCDLDVQEKSKEDVVVTPLDVDEICKCEAADKKEAEVTIDAGFKDDVIIEDISINKDLDNINFDDKNLFDNLSFEEFKPIEDVEITSEPITVVNNKKSDDVVFESTPNISKEKVATVDKEVSNTLQHFLDQLKKEKEKLRQRRENLEKKTMKVKAMFSKLQS
ncbi:MAG: hypothetical protein HUJ42_01180 [Malacoplasma sp.]|nr:hypothetical protein [Malacoplasma sp.]